MHHLDIVTRSSATYPITARLSLFSFGRDRLENIFDMRPRVMISSGHEGRTEPGPHLAARNAATDKQNAFMLQLVAPPFGVWKVTVAPVNKTASCLEVRKTLVNELIHRIARFDHAHPTPRPFELPEKFFQGPCPFHLCTFGRTLQKCIHLRRRPIETNYFKMVIVHVHDEILPHDGQANHPDI